jgi:large subunit ribosomal protein L4e
MKAQILDINGKKTKEINTSLFEEPIREDIIFKVIEAQKKKQPYGPYYLAGIDRSATGSIRHKRHAWKVSYGRGMSRVPRKTMWRRGTQFAWEGAVVPFAKGGRRAFPPQIESMTKVRKINKKELKKALFSALTYVNSAEQLKIKYASLKNKDINVKLPIIVEDKILTLKTKEFFKSLDKILGDLTGIAIQKTSSRAGRGKSRGRKYKKNAGVLFIIGKDENKNVNGIKVMKNNEIKVRDLADGGARLTMFTEKAIKELEERKNHA